MVRAAIVGCGKIADQHVHAIRRIPGSSVAAVCDREMLMAKQLSERFGIAECFDDLPQMLGKVSPDAVHITTPPQSHHDLARRCLEAGSHVYIEKPFTVTAPEAESLIAIAERHGLVVTVGHNNQFTPEMLEMRRLVEEGYLGGKPVHMESFWSYDLSDVDYVRPLLGDPHHWVRGLPGKLLHNIISHGIARLAEFLDDDLLQVTSSAFQSPKLREMDCPDVMDELRVLIRDRAGTTANFCFSTQIKPGLNRFELLGPANSLVVDLVTGSVISTRGKSYKSYLTFLVPPVNSAREHMANARRNTLAFVRWRLHQDAGMKALIERFHETVQKGTTPPIPYREILLTARIMDTIFASIAAEAGRPTTQCHTLPRASQQL
jgi:predicted dehydrogenase